MESHYFLHLYNNLRAKIDFKLAHLIAFSVTSVKFNVRPGYFLEYADLMTLKQPQWQSVIYQILTEYDDQLYYYNFNKVGIIVSKRNLELTFDQLFDNVGDILGFNYNIRNLEQYLETRPDKGYLSYSYKTHDKPKIENVFYTEILLLEDYLCKEGTKQQPFYKQYQKFKKFGELLDIEVDQTINISLSEDTVMSEFYKMKNFSEIKLNVDKIANYFYNEEFEEIGELIADKIESSEETSSEDFFNSNEYIIGLIIYNLRKELDIPNYEKRLKIVNTISDYLLKLLQSSNPVNEMHLVNYILNHLIK